MVGEWRNPVSRPFNLPGMSRDTPALQRALDPGLIARVSGGIRSWIGLNRSPGSPELPFFPPGEPLTPSAPGARGRRFDYPAAYNIGIRPRANEPVSFDMLRAISDPTVGGYDLLRLAIETRKDQMSKLVWSVMPRKQPNQPLRGKSDERCAKIEKLLRRPDGHTAWQQWVSQLIEEHLVIDAPAIYRRLSVTGETIGLELIDGATIKPLLNYDGRRPLEGPAYQQILHGVPAIDYTKDELLYVPRNPRVSKVYGFSTVEQCLVTINIGLRRQLGQLAYFTQGNIPDAIAQLPPDWGVAQIEEFQNYWDGMVNDAVTRRQMRFVPAGVAFQQTRADSALVDQFDEWVARIIAYAFSLPPTPFVKMTNRATAETAYETSLAEGLQPMMEWLKGVLDYIVAVWLEAPDLELMWDDIKKVDPAEKEQRDLAVVRQGIISNDDIRADRGMEPQGLPAIIYGIGPLGFMSVDAVKEVIKNGWDLHGMPAPVAPGMGGELGAATGGNMAALGTGTPDDPLAGLPPEILAALGISDTSPEQDVEAADEQPAGPALAQPGAQEPGSNVIPLHRHPDVMAVYNDGDQMARQMAARWASAGAVE